MLKHSFTKISLKSDQEILQTVMDANSQIMNKTVTPQSLSCQLLVKEKASQGPGR